MKKNSLLLVILCYLVLICMGCSSIKKDNSKNNNSVDDNVEINENIIYEIKERGYLIVGCKTDVPEMSYYDKESKSFTGLEIELAYATAAKIFEVSLEEVKEKELVHFEGVTVANREQMLEDGKVDCLFATYTITQEREERFAFSNSYYKDYIGMMVRKTAMDFNSLGSSDIKSINDLDGKCVGVAKKSTTRQKFYEYIDSMDNVDVTPIFYEYESYDAMVEALKNKEIDVMSVDISILKGYEDASTTILDARFGGQPYGVAVSKENSKLLDYINAVIE